MESPERLGSLWPESVVFQFHSTWTCYRFQFCQFNWDISRFKCVVSSCRPARRIKWKKIGIHQREKFCSNFIGIPLWDRDRDRKTERERENECERLRNMKANGACFDATDTFVVPVIWLSEKWVAAKLNIQNSKYSHVKCARFFTFV